MRSRLILSAAAAALTLGLAACGDSDNSGLLQVNATSGSATAESIPTGPNSATPVVPALAAHLYADVRAVRVHLVDSDDIDDRKDEHGAPKPDEKELDDDDDVDESAGWLTVFEGSTTIDLFDANATGVFITRSRIPSGTITKLRLVLDDVRLVLSTGTFAVRCPSSAQSGLKIKLDQPIAVQPRQEVRVLLVFDRDHTLWIDHHGYVLSPVIDAQVSFIPSRAQ